jgi:hypothetical protein
MLLGKNFGCNVVGTHRREGFKNLPLTRELCLEVLSSACRNIKEKERIARLKQRKIK